MNILASMGPVKFVFIAYFLCIIVSGTVAWIIRLLSTGIKKSREDKEG